MTIFWEGVSERAGVGRGRNKAETAASQVLLVRKSHAGAGQAQAANGEGRAAAKSLSSGPPVASRLKNCGG